MIQSNSMSKKTARELRSAMKEHVQNNCLLSGKDFTLSSGAGSSYYFDCKKATLHGEFLGLFAEYVCDYIVPRLPRQPDLAGGLTLGADFITSALAMYSSANGGPIKQGSIVRKEPKKHGTKSLIENELKGDGKNILVVEDVITSGYSIAKACDEFLAAGYSPVAMLTLVDREVGAISMLEQKYSLPVFAIFTSSDFTI